ncbi:MAG: preprotein translocase subunit YajC [Oscillospiraceae bacterium]|jgi:preprotein translocase subunit YajC|nr:preprotein translocase subunit YajC [Oscillospiraceae bacterium]
MKLAKGLYKALIVSLAVAMLLGAAPFALAEGGGDPAETPGMLTMFSSLFMFIPLIAVFYFLIIRPESKRKKAAAKLRDDLIVSDEVTTVGGIVGKVVQIKDDKITIETSAERTRITVLRGAISSKGEKISD